jgi:DNA-binding transcriptional LysR family regulator
MSPRDGGGDAERWNALELRHLVALREVANQGTFGAAAERLGYTQSAVSQQLAALERIVGQRLLERPQGRRPTGLTAAGRMLLRHADVVFAQMQAARADLAALTMNGGAILRVGTYQSTGVHILPSVLRRFRDEWPQVPVRIREEAADGRLLSAVESGELDVTFATLPASPGPFETTELMHDPYVLAVPADSELALTGRPPSMHELARLPLICFRTCRDQQRAESHLRTRGIEPIIVFRSDDSMTVQAMVAAGVGAALVPRLSMLPASPDITIIEMGSMLPPRVVGIAWHRDRFQPPATSAFIQASADVCTGLRQRPSFLEGSEASLRLAAMSARLFRH